MKDQKRVINVYGLKKRNNVVRKVLTIVMLVAIIVVSLRAIVEMDQLSIRLSDVTAQGKVDEKTIDALEEYYGITLRDPMERELLEFLADDDTNLKSWSEKFNCVGFSLMLMSNAMAAGWRCGLVHIWYYFYMIPVAGSGHAMVAFNVSGRGLVFVEPQADLVMPALVRGDHWKNDTVLSTEIFWCKK